MGTKLSTTGQPIGGDASASPPIEAAESALARHSTPPVGLSSSRMFGNRSLSESHHSNGDVDVDHDSVSLRDVSNISQPSQAQALSNLLSFSFFRSNSTGGHHSTSEDNSHSDVYNPSHGNSQVEEAVEYHHRGRPYVSDAVLSSSASSSGSTGTSAPTSASSHERGIFLDFPVTMRRIMLSAHSLPSTMWAVRDVKCPICEVMIPHDDIDRHLVMCLTRPRLQYNDETLVENKGECVICLEDMEEGHVIARLPCLCIYHKTCIQSWFRHKDSCPTHPDS